MHKGKANNRYSFNEIEQKWANKEVQDIKFQNHLKPLYLLEMWPYPSGKIHMGHVRNYEIGDILRRFYYLKGYKVFRPMGWDAFGLPAENAAIENNIHPKIWTEENIKNMKQTLKKIGYWYDWDHEVATCDVKYYKHQQRLFIDLYHAGLIIKKKDFVNWDPVDQTVLANEQVDANGKSWRSGAIVEKKQIEQWFFNITKYAEELLDDLKLLEGHWPEKVITMQKNWIGKSIGYVFKFLMKSMENKTIEIYTTKPETIFGCTFIVISPESPEAMEMSSEKTQKYLNTPEDQRKSEIIGYCQHPYTQKDLPIYLADYVLASYGTGIVMGVPYHDERDDKFAKTHNLERIKIVDDDGLMINSEFLNGMTLEEARRKLAEKLKQRVCYKIKDWCLSRQRYWGCPIPMYYCPNCGMLPEERLPVILPTDVEINTKGNPLNFVENWVNTTCEQCGAQAKRETDTMDTFVDSSWYFLRFPCVDNDAEPIDNRATVVDIYLGGIEHAVLHLLYARFFTKALRDIGLTKITEPFKSLCTQGMVCHKIYQGKISKKYYFPEDVVEEADGSCWANDEEIEVGPSVKMSKSKKNLIDPNQKIQTFGSDAIKMFVVSDSPVEKDFDWNTNALFGCHKFLQSVWRLCCKIQELPDESWELNAEFASKVEFNLFECSRHLEKMALNLYIAQVRILFNFIEDSVDVFSKVNILFGIKNFLRIFWCVCPFLSYECYFMLFGEVLSEVETWHNGKPLADLSRCNIAIQINGNKKHIFSTNIKDETLLIKEAIELVNIQTYLKYIYVPGKIINFVV